ncbi:MAG: hypothetical protein OXE84_07180 [Rhodobacteraceae bacterium]|nr:hypothetical protein [Paracoccaceae bacterium]MCY4197135.1 hypothetical protein [Paracoccaceae bacterium]MCY4328121.1 hypothetical protein [Paracoccaceae bacterium]
MAEIVRAIAKTLVVIAMAAMLTGCQTHGLPVDPFAPFSIPVDPGPDQ